MSNHHFDRSAVPELPVYVSHKRVRAAKILDLVRLPDNVQDAALQLDLPDKPYVYVTPDWLARRVPLNTSPVGGYFVRYESDGYTSWSPAGAFEDGYTRVAG